MKILQRVFTGLKFWIVQNLVEIIIVLILGYSGFDVMGEFCNKCLLIENIEGTAWGIGFKSLIFLLPYLFLFVAIGFVPYFRHNRINIKNALLNCLVSCLVILLIGILKPNEFKEILRPLSATLLSSLLIILFFKVKAAR